jgi:hypothetical protein
MKWTKCFLVRELETRRIVHHEMGADLLQPRKPIGFHVLRPDE